MSGFVGDLTPLIGLWFFRLTIDGQFDRLLIPNCGALDLIKVKYRHIGGGGGNDVTCILEYILE